MMLFKEVLISDEKYPFDVIEEEYVFGLLTAVKVFVPHAFMPD